MRSRFSALILAFLSIPAFAAMPQKSSSKGKKVAPKKPTASDMVDSESSLPSPIKPLMPVAPEEMASRFFREALKPYGEWITLGEYGKCWKPSGVGARWAPYTVGSWAYSRHGWTWLSNENFGGIVYHYGRWVRSVEEGWCWLPDLEWGASWVAWRYGSEAIGWAPLPPKTPWEPAVGFGPWVDREFNIGPENYSFCAIADFDDVSLNEVILGPSKNDECFLRTVNTTNVAANGKAIFAGGPAYNWVAARVKGKLPVIQVIKERSLVKFRELLNESVDTPANFRSILNETKLTLVAPDWGYLSDPRKADALGFIGEEDEKVKKVVWSEGPPEGKEKDASNAELPSGEKPDVMPEILVYTGWEGVNPRMLSELRAKVSREVAGMYPRTHPAQPFNQERDFPVIR